LLSVGIVIMARLRYPTAELAGAGLSGILLITMAAALYWAHNRSDISKAPWVIGGGMTVFTIWLISCVMPLVSPLVSTKSIISIIPRVSSGNLVEYTVDRPSIMFYSGMRLDRAPDAESVRMRLLSKSPVVALVRPREVKNVTVPGAVELVRTMNMVVLANAPAAAQKGNIP